MSYPHIPDEPIVPWWDDPCCEPDFEEERENAIERKVNELLDRDYERELERESAK